MTPFFKAIFKTVRGTAKDELKQRSARGAGDVGGGNLK